MAVLTKGPIVPGMAAAFVVAHRLLTGAWPRGITHRWLIGVATRLTARALLPQLRERYPRLKLFVSTTTMAGQQVAKTRLPFVDEVFYFPFDLGFIVNRTLRLVKPRLFVMMETEIWPNLLRECRRRGVATMVINGRVSARSFGR